MPRKTLPIERATVKSSDWMAYLILAGAAVFALACALPPSAATSILQLGATSISIVAGVADSRSQKFNKESRRAATMWILLFWPVYLKIRANITQRGMWMYWASLALVGFALLAQMYSMLSIIGELERTLGAA